MRIISVGAFTIAAMLLEACGGGSVANQGAVVPTTNQGASADALVVTHAALNAVPASAPHVAITEFYDRALPVLNAVTVTRDGTVWWNSAVGGASLGRMNGTQVARVTIPAFETIITSQFLFATSDGRAWLDVILPSNTPPDLPTGDGDYLFYARSTSRQAQPAGGIQISGDLQHQGIEGIAVGPDGNIWYTQLGNDLQSINSPAFGCYQIAARSCNGGNLDVNANPGAVVAGPDRNVWVFDSNPFTPFTGFHRYTTGGNLAGNVVLTNKVYAANAAVLGPDGAVWFIDSVSNFVGRVTTSGSLHTYKAPPTTLLSAITLGGDGALWFTDFSNGKVGRITTLGQITEYTLPSRHSEPTAIIGPATSGCGSTELWVAESGTGKVARLIVTP